MGRSKDQWLEETGGFRIGESQIEFQKRVSEIARLEEFLLAGVKEAPTSGKHNMAELEKIQRRLCNLKGIDFDSYDDPNE